MRLAAHVPELVITDAVRVAAAKAALRGHTRLAVKKAAPTVGVKDAGPKGAGKVVAPMPNEEEGAPPLGPLLPKRVPLASAPRPAAALIRPAGRTQVPQEPQPAMERLLAVSAEKPAAATVARTAAAAAGARVREPPAPSPAAAIGPAVVPEPAVEATGEITGLAGLGPPCPPTRRSAHTTTPAFRRPAPDIASGAVAVVRPARLAPEAGPGARATPGAPALRIKRAETVLVIACET